MQIVCPDDYRSWLETMYVLFGTKFSKIFGGPMWSKDPTSQGSSNTTTAHDPLLVYSVFIFVCDLPFFYQARVNIPAVGERTMRRDIATSQFTTGSEIQVAMSEQIVRVLYLSTMHIQLATLNEACKVHPNEKWWIKGDGCDLVSGLEESLKSEWHGDVDFGTGELQSLYDVYMSRLSNIDTLQHSNVNLEDGRASILNFLVKEQEQVTEDVTFIAGGMLIAILTELDT